MKKLFLLLITLTTFTNVSYASFPVTEKVLNINDANLETKDKNSAAISSLGLGIIASAIVKYVLNVQLYSLSIAIIISGLAIYSIFLSYKGMKSKEFRKLARLGRLLSIISLAYSILLLAVLNMW